MSEAKRSHDVEKDVNNQSHGDLAAMGRFEQSSLHQYRSNVPAFAGRLGGQQSVILDRSDPQNAKFLEECPDASPYMTLSEQFDLRPFRTIWIWKAALLEGMGETAISIYPYTFIGVHSLRTY